MRVEFSAVRVRDGRADSTQASVTEMRQLNEETRRELGGRIDDLGTHMRVLHEEVMSRIALLDEHTNGRQSIRHASARQPRKNRKLKD